MRLCHATHKRGETKKCENPIQPTTCLSSRLRATAPCNVSCPRKVRPAKLAPITRDSRGAMNHGTQCIESAVMQNATHARCTGSHHNLLRAGLKMPRRRKGLSSRPYVARARSVISRVWRQRAGAPSRWSHLDRVAPPEFDGDVRLLAAIDAGRSRADPKLQRPRGSSGPPSGRFILCPLVEAAAAQLRRQRGGAVRAVGRVFG